MPNRFYYNNDIAIKHMHAHTQRVVHFERAWLHGSEAVGALSQHMKRETWARTNKINENVAAKHTMVQMPSAGGECRLHMYGSSSTYWIFVQLWLRNCIARES